MERPLSACDVIECEFGYTGHFHHEDSDLVLTYFRGYDAELGRWLSPDPIGEGGGINLYGYVRNNPLNLLDPWGLNADWPMPPKLDQITSKKFWKEAKPILEQIKRCQANMKQTQLDLKKGAGKPGFARSVEALRLQKERLGGLKQRLWKMYKKEMVDQAAKRCKRQAAKRILPDAFKAMGNMLKGIGRLPAILAPPEEFWNPNSLRSGPTTG